MKKNEEKNIWEEAGIPPQNSIKMTKYSSGFGWEIKLYGEDENDIVKRIEKINKKLTEHVNKIGEKNEE